MGKLPYGSGTSHIKASHGADTNAMKFYSSQYGTSYGKNWEGFSPRPGRHTGTGYLSNFRPGVYYNARLDQLDNPTMGHLLTSNYRSMTELDFTPYKVTSSGTDQLPNQVHQVGSGFIRQTPITTPISREVTNAFINTKTHTAPNDILPRAIPRLHKKRAKDPVQAENTGYGPGFMTTESSVRFLGKPSERMDTTRNTLGPNEETGFTHAYNVEPVTFHSNYSHQGNTPGYYTDRPTGTSVMNTAFRPSKFMHGAEPFPTIPDRSERGTGFTHGTKARPVFVNRVMGDAYDKALDIPDAKYNLTKKNDPAEHINMNRPNNHSSINKEIYLGKQRPDKTEPDRLETTGVGYKELSGYCENNDRFVKTADNPRRFITHYDTRFQDVTPVAKDREGHCRGSLQLQKPDGFTKSTYVHSFGPDQNPTASLRNLRPYVAQSIKSQDRFYDDHTHDTKLHSNTMSMVTA